MKRKTEITKHPGGRPTKYSPAILTIVDEYLQSVGREQTELPTIEGLALKIGVDSDTIYNWADAKNESGDLLYPEFFGTIKKIKDLQKNQLMNDGMYGGKEVNSAMAIFLLKANHGMKEGPNTAIQVNFNSHVQKELEEFNE